MSGGLVRRPRVPRNYGAGPCTTAKTSLSFTTVDSGATPTFPDVDAIVSVGHVLNYLDTEEALDRVLIASARALRPGGVLALDLCDRAWGEHRVDSPPHARIGDDWAIITEFETPAPDRFVRFISTFVRRPDGSWRRDDERHDNVLVDTSVIPESLVAQGMSAEIRPAFGSEQPLPGLVVLHGTKS
jgi:SAM-dependent methyltransferase